VIAGRQHADAKFEKFFGDLRCEPESAGRILGVGNNQIDLVLVDKMLHPVTDNGPTGTSKNVSNEEQAQRVAPRF
jgi:hypothetical protein